MTLVAFVLLLLAWLLLMRNRSRLTASRSNVDGEMYQVLAPRSQDASNALARLRRNVAAVLEVASARAQSTQRQFIEPLSRLSQRLEQTGGLKVCELDYEADDAIALNRNKSELILICMRVDPPHDMSIAADDTLLFIALHEMAHTMDTSYAPLVNGHTVHDRQFRNNENFLMGIAAQLQLLQPHLVPGRTHCRYTMPNPSSAP